MAAEGHKRRRGEAGRREDELDALRADNAMLTRLLREERARARDMEESFSARMIRNEMN